MQLNLDLDKAQSIVSTPAPQPLTLEEGNIVSSPCYVRPSLLAELL